MSFPLGSPMTGPAAIHALDQIDRVPATLEEWKERYPNGIQIQGMKPTFAKGTAPKFFWDGIRGHFDRACKESGPNGRRYLEKSEQLWHVKRVVDAITSAVVSGNPDVHRAQLAQAMKVRHSLATALSAIDDALITVSDALEVPITFLPEIPAEPTTGQG